MKEVIILGSTGSIGTQALDVVRENPELFKISALSCGNNIDLFKKQILEFRPSLVCVKEEDSAREVKAFAKEKNLSLDDVLWGEEGLKKIAIYRGDILLNSLMGMMGLVPTYNAILSGKDIALANKETLVTGGRLVMDAIKREKVRLLPVDSEHSAIFQCLMGNSHRQLKRILLTASGGPFRSTPIEELEKVRVEDALNHPNWSMGKKITIDSATMMNKGLEVIEAKWLFNVDLEQIQVVVHPQSILHSAVEFVDTSIIGQFGLPDMRIPISLALGYPNRISSSHKSLDLFEMGSLTFERPDLEKFPCLKMAFEAEEKGGSYPVVLNGANEALVSQFLEGKIGFMDIPRGVYKALEEHKPIYDYSIDDVLEIDKEVRSRI